MAESVPLFASLLAVPVPANRYPPLNLSPQRQRQQTLAAIIAIMLQLSERRPVLLILEDLQWADPTTLAWIELLIEQVSTATICVVLTCRPEFQPTWT